MALIIGLTGSIASGKSAVSSMFADFNIPVVDADKVAREVVNPGEDAYNAIIQTFGQEILQADRTLDRKKLGSIIFSDEAKRKQLNNIIHPAIRDRMAEQQANYVKSGEKCVVLDIPLLFEGKRTGEIDKVLVVYVDEEVQLERLMARDNSSEEEARQRIQSQIPVKNKVEKADGVINNNGTIEDSSRQLIKLLKKWDIIQ